MVNVPLIVTYSANGGYTWTAPPGVTSVTAVVWGAGGGGGSASNTSGSNGGGGGGGQVACETAVAVTPGSSYTVTVGAGGPGGAAGTDGTAGGFSAFTGDTLAVIAPGGQQGTAGVGGAGQGGNGGTGSTNSVTATGGAGDDGTAATDGGGGGGAAGTDTVQGFMGNSASGSTAGAASRGTYQGGAGGGGAASAGAGSNGSGPGGGGGGALSTGTQHGGGNGADGQVIITWTQSDPITLNAASPGGTVQMQAPLGVTTVKAECWGAGAGGFNSQSSGSAVAGSTTFPAGYGGGSDTQAAGVFDGYVSRPLAITAQVRYWHEGDTYPANSQNLPQLAAMGAKVYACLKPQRIAVVNGGAQLTAEKSTLSTSVTNISNVSGLVWVAVLWQESTLNGKTGNFGDGTTGPKGVKQSISTPGFPASNTAVTNSQGVDAFVNLTGGTISAVVVNGTDVTLGGGGQGVYLVPSTQTIKITYTGSPSWAWWLSPYGAPGSITESQSAANYIAYHHAYAPTIRSAVPGIQIAYKPAVTSIAPTIDMFPGTGNTGCDMIMCDFYGLDLVKQTNSTTIFGPGTIEAVADANGLALGLGEWGLTNGVTVPTQAQWNTFVSALVTGFTNRINAGKPVGDVIFYTGQTAGGPNNVTGPTDFKVAGIQQVSDLISSSATPVGGAGGGGGEYAAEASLAISSPAGTSRYTLNVGAGGAGRTSGANTSIAGDSVTVTASGGSVAVAQSVGGTGGTGSSNTTHHDGGAGGAGGGNNGGGGGGGASAGPSNVGGTGFAGTPSSGGSGGIAPTGGGPGGKGGGPNGGGSPPTSGPGGGGGARGANGNGNGSGADGQITLSNFATGVAATGSLALGGLQFSGTSTTPGGAFALAGLTLSGSGTVTGGGWSRIQNGPSSNVASGNLTLTLPAPSMTDTLLVAQIASNGTTAITGPAGWAQLATKTVGGTGGAHCETWFYNQPGDGSTGTNPGGITSAVFNAGSNGIRGHLAEYKPLPPNTIPVLNGTPATASGGTGATSIGPVTCGAGTNAGDLGLTLFQDFFSTSVTITITPPTGWTSNQAQGSSIANTWNSDCDLSLNAGAQSATATFTPSTNQTGWAAIFAVFTPTVRVATTGTLALAPLTFAATGTSGVPAGTVVSNGGLQIGPLGFQSPSLATTFPQKPLPVLVEILVNGSWTDITSYVYTRDGINITGRGRPDEASAAQPTQVTLTINNRDGSFSPQNTSGQFYPYLTRNTQIRISVVNVVTPLGANYSGYRFWGEVPAWPPLWNVAQTDVYVSITACGVLQRMSQSKFSASSLTRYYTNIYNQASRFQFLSGPQAPAGYWPCEDGGSAGSFASGIPGGSPMTWTGKPLLAADNSVPGSGAFAQLQGSIWTGTPGAFSSGGFTFANPGTYLWTCPGGVTSIKAECWGGGGGGASGTAPCGGGGGEYAVESTLAVTPGVVYSLTVGAGGSGGPGAFVGHGNSGSAGASSTFSGDTVTVTAHGGKGGRVDAAGGAGGSGSSNSTHHSGGTGGGARVSGYGGSGGGSSGGSAAAGHAGTAATSDAGAPGGTAVTDGGPGGTGGHGGNVHTAGITPSPGPGGGGGGGGLNPANNFGERGGNGAAGQVRLTFGTSTMPPANVVRALIDVPSTGGTDSANLLSFTTTGDFATVNLVYHTGGNLQLIAKNLGGSTIADSGSHAFGLDGQPTLVSIELTSASVPVFGGAIQWKLTAITPGAAAVVATYKGTFVSIAGLGSVTQVSVNNAAGHTDTTATGVGHVSVQYSVDPVLHLSQALNAHTGETAATRFLRLCGEQNVPAVLTGNQADTPQMGPQPVGLLVALLQDCESADLGQMFELRDAFGLGYRTRVSMQNQMPAAVLDYGAGQVSPPLAPTDDDQLTRNDVIATRASGSTTFGTSYEVLQATGPLSVMDPPNGVGLYSYSVSANLFADNQLVGFAAWLLALGTLDEYRYPVITIDLRRAANADGTFGNVASLDIGDYLQIINSAAATYAQTYAQTYSGPPPWLPPMPINQLCFGFAETINAFEWVIAVNAVPEDPYTSGSGGNTAPLPTW